MDKETKPIKDTLGLTETPFRRLSSLIEEMETNEDIPDFVGKYLARLWEIHDGLQASVKNVKACVSAYIVDDSCKTNYDTKKQGCKQAKSRKFAKNPLEIERFSTWNYRLIQQKDGTVGMHEVYYDKAGNPVACIESPIDVTGEDKKEIRNILKKLDAAMKKPTLQTSIFEKTKSSMAMDRLAELDRELGL